MQRHQGVLARCRDPGQSQKTGEKFGARDARHGARGERHGARDARHDARGERHGARAAQRKHSCDQNEEATERAENAGEP